MFPETVVEVAIGDVVEAFRIGRFNWFTEEEDLQGLLYHKILIHWVAGGHGKESEVIPYVHLEYPTRGLYHRKNPIYGPLEHGSHGEFDLVILSLDQEPDARAHGPGDYLVEHAFELKYERMFNKPYTYVKTGSMGRTLRPDYAKLTEVVNDRATIAVPSHRHMIYFNDPEPNENLRDNKFRDVDGVQRVLGKYYRRKADIPDQYRVKLERIHFVLSEPDDP